MQRGPLPWGAVLRGGLAMLPLLLSVLADRPSLGVPAALGAMLAGFNDRPGSRRGAVLRLGLPALIGALGLFLGACLGEVTGGGRSLVVLPLALGVLGFVAGAMSSTGPVASSCGTQLLVAAVIGAGMPLPEPGWHRAALFLLGAGWLLTLRLVLPSPVRKRGGTGAPYLLDGEREAVAAVYVAVAELLRAAGSDRAPGRRAALSAALDHAQDTLAGPRLTRRAGSAAERRLHAQYAAAFPLVEAATALAWAGKPLPPRIAEGPDRLARAVLTGAPCGALPAPARSGAGLRALDEALLRAAADFDRREGGRLRTTGTADRVPLVRRAFGPAGRAYGIRVALCCGASAVLAQLLRHDHWYWLPATAVFLVKPDLGPLASRVLCRAAGTVAGAALYAVLPAAFGGPGVAVAAVVVCGALVPVSTRHFAAQTAVVTVLVLSLVRLSGEPAAGAGRVVESLLACALVLVIGHVRMPGQRMHAVRSALDTASSAAHRYLRHVLDHPGDGDRRGDLRRDAYRSLAVARHAIELSAAELPPVARRTAGSAEVAQALEMLIDTTTACAVHLDGRPTGLSRSYADRLTARLAALDAARAGTLGPERSGAGAPVAVG
ncbi:FUSC family protein [Streptomyces sp. NBC_01218]|uniref:FUSC family protein n=1 Tax=unclassified Streptomyces TaxID=2593676 RepID=UPI0023B942A0|nr:MULTISPECIES: FUSC family protein [unclassified Streptomyces]WEH38112.1 FUSC family protein [Streptomyces sp. AM 2-1-1]WSQ55165.1 FUSC family protein [Streptomyces sp. NBC_01218]